jgi:hypothetical protein
MATVRRPTPTTFAEAFARGYERGVPAALRLLRAGLDVDDAHLATALTHLARSDDPRAPRAFDRLVDAGANVDALDVAGTTALAVAAGYGRHALADRLLKLGADPNRGKPPAMQNAIHERDLRMIRLLTRAGAASPSSPTWVRSFVTALTSEPGDVVTELVDHVDPTALWLDRFDHDSLAAVASMTRLRALSIHAFASQSLAAAVPSELQSHPSLEVIVIFGGRAHTSPLANVLTSMPNLQAVHIAQHADATVDVPGVEITYGA